MISSCQGYLKVTWLWEVTGRQKMDQTGKSGAGSTDNHKIILAQFCVLRLSHSQHLVNSQNILQAIL